MTAYGCSMHVPFPKIAGVIVGVSVINYRLYYFRNIRFFNVTGTSVVVCAGGRPDMRTKPVSISTALSARGVVRYDIFCSRGVL